MPTGSAFAKRLLRFAHDDPMNHEARHEKKIADAKSPDETTSRENDVGLRGICRNYFCANPDYFLDMLARKC